MNLEQLQLAYELIMSALALWREAQSEPKEGKQGVWNVIKNRAERPGRFGKGFSGVVTKPLQFSSFNRTDSMSSKFPKANDPSWIECLRVVSEDQADNTFGADHYFADYIEPPSWADGMAETIKIGRHRFFKES